MLTTGDVVAISRVSVKVLSRWCDRGLKPALGKGHHRTFSRMELLGIFVGNVLHQIADSQTGRDHAFRLAKYIANLPEQKLLNALAEGRTFPESMSDGRFRLVKPRGPRVGCHLNLQRWWDDVSDLIERAKENTPRTVHRGRRTGLAAGD